MAFVPIVPPIYKTITGPDPAVGQNILITVPLLVQWQYESLKIVLVTAAGGVVRTPKLTVEDAVGVVLGEYILPTLSAANTGTYTIMPESFIGLTQVNNATFPLSIPLPRLGPGFKLRTVTTSLQAGDNYSAPILYVKEYP